MNLMSATLIKADTFAAGDKVLTSVGHTARVRAMQGAIKRSAISIA